MVSYTKAQFSKNNNKIKMSQHKYQNSIETMPHTVTYHGPSTTSHV